MKIILFFQKNCTFSQFTRGNTVNVVCMQQSQRGFAIALYILVTCFMLCVTEPARFWDGALHARCIHVTCFMLYVTEPARFCDGALHAGRIHVTCFMLQSQRGFAMALYTLGVYMGFSSSFLLIMANRVIGWRYTYFVAGFLGVALGMVMMLTVREPKRPPPPIVKAVCYSCVAFYKPIMYYGLALSVCPHFCG